MKVKPKNHVLAVTDHSFLWLATPTHSNSVLSGLTPPACAQTAFRLFGPARPIQPHQLFGWDHSWGTSSSTTPCSQGKGPIYPAPPQPSLLTCWAAPATSLTDSDLSYILTSLSFHFKSVFSSLCFVTRLIFQHKMDVLVLSPADTSFHPQLTALSLQLPMTYGVCLSLIWQILFHFLWFLVYKTKLPCFSILPSLGPIHFEALIFRLHWWQGVKDWHS